MRDGSQLCKNFVRQQSQEKKQTECLRSKLHHTDLQEGQGSDIYRAEENSVKQGQRSEPRPARWREIADDFNINLRNDKQTNNGGGGGFRN